MEERGVRVDHATIQRWVLKYSPQLEEALVLSQSSILGAKSENRVSEIQ